MAIKNKEIRNKILHRDSGTFKRKHAGYVLVMNSKVLFFCGKRIFIVLYSSL